MKDRALETLNLRSRQRTPRGGMRKKGRWEESHGVMEIQTTEIVKEEMVSRVKYCRKL